MFQGKIRFTKTINRTIRFYLSVQEVLPRRKRDNQLFQFNLLIFHMMSVIALSTKYRITVLENSTFFYIFRGAKKAPGYEELNTSVKFFINLREDMPSIII